MARIYEIYGNDAHSMTVSLMEAADRVGYGLIIDQRSADGVIEGMHHTCGYVFSVQWHPERMCFKHRREDTVDGSKILAWFLNRCRNI